MQLISFSSYTKDLPDYPVISETNYLALMKGKVVPYLKARRHSSYLSREGSQKLFYKIYHSDAKEIRGTVAISHGFSESTMKYHEVIYYFLKEGYHVAICDHRGHGFSRNDKETDIANTASYVRRFQYYVKDFHAFMTTAVMPELPGPYYLYAHSMGGCIGALYLEQHPDIFKKAILNAPMLEVDRGGMPKWAAKLITTTACALGQGRHFLMGQTPFSSKEDFEHSASNCKNRYLYYYHYRLETPKFQNSGSSYRWAKEAMSANSRVVRKRNCKKVRAEVLLLQAEYDTYVLPKGQTTFIKNIKKGTLIRVPHSKHEIYLSTNQVLKKYWSAVFKFLK